MVSIFSLFTVDYFLHLKEECTNEDSIVFS